MATATDALRTKTDAELQFFVDNPGYYHADLVLTARQELRRRRIGVVGYSFGRGERWGGG
jgi:hypothetical protein